MNKTFYAEKNYFETFIAICNVCDVSYSSIINELVKDYIKTHYQFLFRTPGVKELVGEIDPELHLDEFVEKIALLSIVKRKKVKPAKVLKQVKTFRRYVKREAAVTNVCEPEDVKHDIY